MIEQINLNLKCLSDIDKADNKDDILFIVCRAQITTLC